MKRHLSIAAAAVVYFHSSAFAQFCDDADFRELPLVVMGTNVFEFLQDTDSVSVLYEEFRNLDGEPPIDFRDEVQLRRLISSIEGTGPKVAAPRSMTGLSGFSTYLFALAALDDLGRVTGKIRDYVYDSELRTGHLAVDTRVETKTAVYCYHWDIDVVPLETGFQVEQRDPGWSRNGPGSPFPGSGMDFDTVTLDNIDSRDLDHKLSAIGTDIVVRHVYRQVDEDRIERLDDSHEFYISTSESCIDLMTSGEPPPLALPRRDATDEPLYCLGRCAHPAIVNTE